MPNVIINFEVRESGIDEVLDGLVQTDQVEQRMADNVRKTNTAFSEQAKVTNQTTTATEKLSNSLKNIPKVIVGGASKEISDLQKNAVSGGLAIDALGTAVNMAKRELQGLAPGTRAFKELSAELQASIIINENLNKSFKSTRAEVTAMRESLIQLEEEGLENTRVFTETQLRAGQMSDALGDASQRVRTLASDTFALDAGIQTVQGLAGAFSVFQGVQALVGDESEDLQRALLKVNAAMAILNGLQQVQNILQKQSAISIATETALQRLQTIQTNLAAAAESRFIVVRYAAIVAQKALTAVMATGPLGLLLIAITAAAGALLIFSQNSEDAADAQAELAEQSQKTVAALNDEIAAQERLRNTRAGGLTQIRQEIAELQARGAVRSQILALEQQAIDQEIQNALVRRETFAQDAATQKEYDDANSEIVQLRSERRLKEIEELKARADESKEILEKQIKDERQLTDAFLRDQTAANEAAVIEAAAGFEKLSVQILAIEAKLRQTLANPDLTTNERVLAELQAGEAIKEARQQLLGELESLQRDHNINLTAADQNQILQNASIAQQQLAAEQEKQNAILAMTQARIEAQRQQELAAAEFGLSIANTLTNAISEITKNSTDAQLENLKQQLDQGLITQQQFDQQSTALKKKQAQQDKNYALFSAFIQQSLAILKVLSDSSIPVLLRPFYIAATIATAAAQIAAIQSRTIPEFFKGTKSSPEGPAKLAERGPELTFKNGKWQYFKKPTISWLSQGTRVFTADETAQLVQSNNFSITAIPSHKSENTNTTLNIDYGKLGAAVGREIQKLPIQVNNLDERGYSQRIISFSSYRNYLNKRYSSK